MPELPKNFRRSRLSPRVEELEWLYEWLRKWDKDNVNVLEFGCGPTTWAIFNSVRSARYLAVETWIDSIDDVSHYLPEVEIIQTTWLDLPMLSYDLVFVDSSAGHPSGREGLFRDEAVQWAEEFMSIDAIIILHDWHSRSGRKPRQYLEDSGYGLLDSVSGHRGVGIYQKKCASVS